MNRKKCYLVGYTGFVGSNLFNMGHFDKVANSKNVEEMYGDSPDILIYAGVTGTKWFANANEELDNKVIIAAENNIRKIKPKKIILISSVDVYDDLTGKDEEYKSDISKLHIYGRNRLSLEEWVENNYEDYHIIRLPAIYGDNLKKNFVYDLIHYVPQLMDEKFFKKVRLEYKEKYQKELADYYKFEDGRYELSSNIDTFLNGQLYTEFKYMENNALCFTNANSEYQFYNLKYLWNDIQNIVNHEIKKVNIVTEPLKVKDICEYVDGISMNKTEVNEIHYNLISNYSALLGQGEGYFCDKNFVLKDLRSFINRERMLCEN